MKNLIYWSVLSVMLLTGCKSQSLVQSQSLAQTSSVTEMTGAQKPIQMILDTDFGSSTDDCFALMMIHHYMDEGKVDLKGIIVDREGEKNAQLVDVFDTYYGHPNIPIGVERNGVKNPRCFIPYNGICDLKDKDGQYLFRRTQNVSNLPDGYKLYRKLLSQAEDHSVVVVAIGFVTTLSELFDSGADEFSQDNGVDLFGKKVKSVYIQSGRFESGDSLCGYNMRAAARQSAVFYDRLPKNVELIMSPSNVGDAMDYAAKDVLSDLSKAEVNPIKAVYTYYTCDTGQRMWDTNCLVNAVLGDSEYNMSSRGWVTFINKGEESLMLFKKDAAGNARYQLPGDSYFAENKLIDIRRHTRIVPNPSANTIEAPQPQLVRGEAVEWTKARLTQLADKYIGTAGNTLDPHDLLMLYRPLGYTGLNASDFSEAVDIVTDEVYDRMLQKAIRNGKKNLVIVSGPPACGKTMVVKTLNAKNAGLIYDADLSKGNRLSEVIRKAKAAGMEKITFVPVYNDPLSCYKNSIDNAKNNYRYTAMDELVSAFRSNENKIQAIQQQYPDIEIIPVDCDHNNGGRKVTLQDAEKWDYSVSEAQLHDLFTYLNSILDDGMLTGISVEQATGNVQAIQTESAENKSLAREITEKAQAIIKEYRMR